MTVSIPSQPRLNVFNAVAISSGKVVLRMCLVLGAAHVLSA
jgi:hypothetical protein